MNNEEFIKLEKPKYPSTNIKTWLDESNDTLWEICPFCNAYVKDLSYQGNRLAIANSFEPSIHSHIAAEHGMRRVRIGKRYRWLRVPPQYQAEAKRKEERRLRTRGKDSMTIKANNNA
ncbi:MAG: hypothetical protein M3247_08665 [Thermoproteota archaeon]|nr:hypothetical protein [Thermoproteota archaeon]